MDATQLKRIPLFADASDEDLAKVAAFAESKEIAEGEVVVEEGGFSRELLAIEEGSAEVTREGEHIAELLRAEVGLRAEIDVVAPGALPRSERKTQRVQDHRTH